MTEKKVFCEECRDDVTYTISYANLSGKIKGKDYTYRGKIAHCINCNSEIYVNEINDYNLMMLYGKYKEVNDII